MFIKNYKKLSRTPIRRDALSIVSAGVLAADPTAVMRKKIEVKGSVFSVGKERIDFSGYKDIYVVGGGKAAFRGAKFLEGAIASRITAGAILDVKAGKLKKIKCYKGAHPFPSGNNMRATDKVVEILNKARKGDLVIALISGGGSSLFCRPDKLTCADIKSITEKFFGKGANIKEINTVRKHISKIHGGYMAKLAYPADVLGLIFSDVPFSDISHVASGPTFMDKTTKADAKKVAKKYGLGNMPFIETPKDKKYFKNVKNIMVLSNKDALLAMKKEAERLGYKAKIYSLYMKGKAREAGGKLAEKLGSGKEAVIAGGETTVVIEKKGKGGRNLEVAIGAMDRFKKGMVAISLASDGKDNIKGVGGGLVDGLVKQKAKEIGYDYKFFLKENKSYKFLKDTGGLILTDRTGTNVSDLMAVLQGKQARSHKLRAKRG